MIDRDLTFGSFVVTPSNQIAADAARRVAEMPAAAYNPLVIVGGAGMGKTHLLHAIANAAVELRPASVPMLTSATDLASGREALDPASLLLIDDVHLLSQAADRRTVAESCLAAISEGAQVVVALRTFEGAGEGGELTHLLGLGLVVELEGEAESIRGSAVEATHATTTNKTDGLSGPSHLQDAAAEPTRPLSTGPASPAEQADQETLPNLPATNPFAPADEFGSFLEDLSRVVAVAVENVPWRRMLAEAIAIWEGQGIRTDRLEAALDGSSSPEPDSLLAGFDRDATRLIEIRAAMGADAASHALDNPDQLAAAEVIFAEWQEGTRNVPAAPIEVFRTVDPWFLDPDRLVLSAFDIDGRVPGDRR